jgi:integrase
MLLALGFNLKDVQEWLGHSDIKMTANIYAHLDVTRKQTMADTLGARLSAQPQNALEQALELGQK